MEKFKFITIIVVGFLSLIVNSMFIDLYIFPREKTQDNITEYREIKISRTAKFGNSERLIGFKFFTQKGFEFNTDQTYIQENNIIIEHTRFFKNVTGVMAKDYDYTNKLMSDLNGVFLYLYIILDISTTISLLVLLFNKNLNKNGLQNIILFNLSMLFFIIILYVSI